jgi:ABC-type amino acid transport substrate-binding protein
MKQALCAISLLITCLFFSGNSAAEERPTILIYHNDSMPWCGTINGKPSGITIDILTAISEHGGPLFKFEQLPWARAQIYAKKNTGTAIIPLTRTAAREDSYTWIVNLVPNTIRLTTTAQNLSKLPDAASVSDDDIDTQFKEHFKTRAVGVIRASAIIPYLEANGFSRIVETNNAEHTAEMLASGRIKAMVESKWVDSYAWKQTHEAQELADDPLVSGPELGDRRYIYLAANTKFPKVASQSIQDAMQRVIESGKLEEILTKWQN